LAWLTFSSGISFYFKWFFTEPSPLPIFLTAISEVVHIFCSRIIVALNPKAMPKKKPLWMDYMMCVIPTGLIVGLEITLHHMGIPEVRMMLSTIIRCTVPLFAIFFVWILDFIQMNYKLVISMALIIAGIIQTVHDEEHLNLGGYLLIQMSCVLSGVRLSLVQLLLSDPNTGVSNAVATIYYMSPWITISMFMASLLLEGPTMILQRFFYLPWQNLAFKLSGASFAGLITFTVASLTVRVIMVSDAVTFATGIVIKETLIVFMSTFFFQEKLNNYKGFILILVGMIIYNIVRAFSGYGHGHKHEEEELSDSELVEPELLEPELVEAEPTPLKIGQKPPRLIIPIQFDNDDEDDEVMPLRTPLRKSRKKRRDSFFAVSPGAHY
jgi:hypothetical protein